MRMLTTTCVLLALASPAIAWKEDYAVLKFGILSGENEADRLARNEPLRSFLESELGVEVEIFTAGNYDGVIQAMAADQIEVARFGSSSYAAAYTATDGGVLPTLTEKNADGSTGYYSIVVSRCDSGINNLDDAKGMVHAFADPDSTSGYAVPYFNMVQQGYDPTTHFSAIPFSGSHEAGVTGVVNGTFDTASTWMDNPEASVYSRMEDKGMIEEGVVCTIWESPEITSGPWTFRSNLPADLVEDVTAAIEKFPTADPEGYAYYASITDDNENPPAGFVRVDHDRYQWIIDMRAWLAEQRRG